MELAYRNIVYVFAFVLLIIVIGFYKTYFGLFPTFDNVASVVHIHAAAFMLWSLLLIAQPLLIRYKRLSIHRALGKLSYVLAPFVVLSTLALARHMFLERQGSLTVERNLSSLFLPISHMILFSLLYILAIVNKKRSPIHMRYIIAASFVVFAPAISRINFSWIGLPFSNLILSYLFTDLFIASLIAYDWYKKKIYKPYFVALFVFIVIHFSTFYLPNTALWQSFAATFVRIFF